MIRRVALKPEFVMYSVLAMLCVAASRAQEFDALSSQADHAMLQRIEDAPPETNFELIERELGDLRRRNPDPDRYATMVYTVFSMPHQPSPNYARLEQRYVLSALDRPALLSTLTMLHLTMRLRADVKSSTGPAGDDARAKLNLIFEAWRRMEGDTDETFRAGVDMPVENVMPPGNGFPGMSPALISDARLREEYLQMIDDNRRRIAAANMQIGLRNIRDSFARHAESFTLSAIRTGLVDVGEVFSHLNGIQSEAARERIVEAIRTHTK